jgi:FdhD protein
LRPADAQARTPDELHVTLHQAPNAKVRAALTRTHEIRSSCGVCGVVDAQAILERTPPLLPGVPRVSRARIGEFAAALQREQALFASTGGCHGARLTTADGVRLGAGEDVGRHNALDKAIGEAARAGHDLSRAVAVLSGRAGYDLVVKCLRVRIPVIVSVSAPCALAFDLCAEAGATLVGFARGDRCEIYCGAERIAAP